jgi:hypothetical protein
MAKGTWKNPEHFKRCAGKRRYRTIAKAALAADRASRRTGELIITYDCPDCGCRHIGHADRTQLVLRDNLTAPICRQCARPIPIPRQRRSTLGGNDCLYCSEACRRAYNKAFRETELQQFRGVFGESVDE